MSYFADERNRMAYMIGTDYGRKYIAELIVKWSQWNIMRAFGLEP